MLLVNHIKCHEKLLVPRNITTRIIVLAPVRYNYYNYNTVETPNKGHVGDNVNSLVLSIVERLSSPRSSVVNHTVFHAEKVGGERERKTVWPNSPGF